MDTAVGAEATVVVVIGWLTFGGLGVGFAFLGDNGRLFYYLYFGNGFIVVVLVLSSGRMGSCNSYYSYGSRARCVTITRRRKTSLICSRNSCVYGTTLVASYRPDPFDIVRLSLGYTSDYGTKYTGGIRSGRQVTYCTIRCTTRYYMGVNVTYTMRSTRYTGSIFFYGGTYSKNGGYLPITPTRKLGRPDGYTTSYNGS